MNRYELKKQIRAIMPFYEGSPPIGVIADALKITAEEAQSLLIQVQDEEAIVRKKKRPATRRKKEKAPVTVPKVIEPEAGLHELPVGAIKWMSLIISVTALVRAFMYAFEYFCRADPPVYAALMAGMIAMVTFVSPQIFIIGWRQKQLIVGLFSLALVLVFVWVSIQITIDVLDYSRTAKDNNHEVQNEQIIRARDRVTQIDNEIEKASKEVEIDVKERDILTRSLESLVGKETTPAYVDTRTRLNSAKKRIDTNNQLIAAKENERNSLKNTSGYFTALVKTSDKKASERNLDTAFAIGLDIVGPAFLCFSLFLTKRVASRKIPWYKKALTKLERKKDVQNNKVGELPGS